MYVCSSFWYRWRNVNKRRERRPWPVQHRRVTVCNCSERSYQFPTPLSSPPRGCIYKSLYPLILGYLPSLNSPSRLLHLGLYVSEIVRNLSTRPRLCVLYFHLQPRNSIYLRSRVSLCAQNGNFVSRLNTSATLSQFFALQSQ
jgi:hypothetical protein